MTGYIEKRPNVTVVTGRLYHWCVLFNSGARLRNDDMPAMIICRTFI